MYLEPLNRHLLVSPLFEEQEETKIILPESYKRPESPYVVCDILGVSKDCKIDINIGNKIVVDRSMIQEIKAAGETNYLVLENYVYGRLQNE
jgi:co-chaperonin GroES (HSP10)|tara:strand:- start:4 stop:279 length:276 start_codon:yes stop_codon:yes gene_type:complete